MKYIRTKDDVYVLSEAYWAGNTDEIISEADTIEELCEQFIIYDTHKKKWLIFRDLKSLIAYCDSNGLDKTQIKGAIWTDKGLIYVAKMDNEGKLVLM